VIDVCKRFGVSPVEAEATQKAGMARAVRDAGAWPLNGLRHPVEGAGCGWYLWAGEEFSHDADFFQPVHVEHLKLIRPEVLPYLALPPGWRFLIAPGYEDVWYDEKLLDI
jgi:hypothetical protein